MYIYVFKTKYVELTSWIISSPLLYRVCCYSLDAGRSPQRVWLDYGYAVPRQTKVPRRLQAHRRRTTPPSPDRHHGHTDGPILDRNMLFHRIWGVQSSSAAACSRIWFYAQRTYAASKVFRQHHNHQDWSTKRRPHLRSVGAAVLQTNRSRVRQMITPYPNGRVEMRYC